MATATLDGMLDLAATEEFGVVTQLTRSAQVTGLNQTNSSALAAALSASGMPAVGSTAPGNENLVLVRRIPRIRESSPDVADVTLEYVARRYAAFNYWSGLGINNGSLFTWSGGTNLNQTTTQLDRNGNQVTVSHTFAESDPDPAYAGETKTQGADVPVRIPNSTVVGRGMLRASYPDVISKGFAGYLNSNVWAGERPYTWQCVSVDWDPVDTTLIPRLFEFTFTFEHDPFTHLPQVFYRDERTGRAPDGIASGTGYKYVDFYPAMDFNRFFPL